MPHRQARVFTTASSVIQDEGRLSRIDVTGVVCDQVGASVLAACHDDLLQLRPLALIASYENADVRLDAHKLMTMAQKMMQPGSALRVPTALVVKRDEIAMWGAYCKLQGMRGVLRAAFTDAEMARQWAAQQAAIWEAQSRFWASRQDRSE